MTLKTWMAQNSHTATTFAKLIGLAGVNPTRTVERWMTGEAIPRPASMAKIKAVTAGQVTPSSFYEATTTNTDTNTDTIIWRGQRV